jgi:hypothetical protein
LHIETEEDNGKPSDDSLKKCLINGDLDNLYSSSNIICIRVINSRRMIWQACNTHGKDESTYRILVGKLVGKRPLGRDRHRLE